MTPMNNLRALRLALGLIGGLAAVDSKAAEPADRGDGAHAYIGLELTLQSVIAGALVNGVDTLAQDTRPVLAVVGGVRWRFDNGVMIGAEAAAGFGDMTLTLRDAGRALSLTYDNDFEWRIGGVAGLAVGPGRGTTLFAYVSETTRTFDVMGATSSGQLRQSDEQGLLRFGVGAEHAMPGPWALRATIGSSRADFGDRATNIDPEEPLEVGLAAVAQF